MGDARAYGRVHADVGVRRRRQARVRGDDDPGPLPVARVVLFGARGCHLCERARDTIAGVARELPFELQEVDITGVPELEQRYRELLPVVEIDGRRAFFYHVPEEAFRRAVTAQAPTPEPGL